MADAGTLKANLAANRVAEAIAGMDGEQLAAFFRRRELTAVKVRICRESPWREYLLTPIGPFYRLHRPRLYCRVCGFGR